jgi:DNA-directed RNA polymerase specialized sigma24 family protein
VVAHVDHLYRVAFHLGREVEDLVQETYARAISSYDQFALGSHMKAWLTRILYNLFFDQMEGIGSIGQWPNHRCFVRVDPRLSI